MQIQSELLEQFKTMLRIRRLEETLAERYQEQEMRCPIHLSIGQEAIPAGVSYWLNPEDHVFSNHRSHGHYLAKGGSLDRLVAELYGRVTGCCQGRGGSMHLIDTSAGFMGSTPVTGGTVPLATGSAWAAKLKNEARVSVVYFGDGSFEEGVVHESLNFAALKKLPVIFVCENNGYAAYTSLEKRQPRQAIHTIAEAHGLSAFVGDGNDVSQVSTLSQYAIKQAREEHEPQFLEFHTHRWREHCGPWFDDDLGYREEGELEYWLARCPIKHAEQQLNETGTLDSNLLQQIENEIAQEISNAFEFAMQSDVPDIAQQQGSVYAA